MDIETRARVMSTAITLTPALRKRLAAMGRRARLLQAVRGLSVLVVVLGLSSGAVLFADYSLDLSASLRKVFFCTWAGVGIGLLLLGVLVPLRRRMDARALAAVIEQQYPDLRERLTSSVELAESNGRGHGSPGFIAQLMDEAERQSSQIDFRPALPARRPAILAVLAAVVVLLTLAPAFVWPRQYADLTQRFFHPWYLANNAAYTIEVAPGDAIAGRGRTITVSAHLVPRNAKLALPDRGTLVVVGGDGTETRQEMDRDEKGDFTVDYKVPCDVTYRIEAGEAISDFYRVIAVTPVELAAESPCITVTPPAYARATKEEETYYGLVDLSALQHSEVRFTFRFTRPAEAAFLEWTEQGESGEKGDSSPLLKTSNHALDLGDDRQTASFTMTATTAGKYRVVLEAERGIRTVLDGGTLSVRADQPPSVVKFAGIEGRAVQKSERVPLEIETADDIGVAGIELEYRVNEGQPVRQQLTLPDGESPMVRVRHFPQLSGKVQEEDRIHYRFHIRDNLPAEYQGPHVIVYPVDRWLSFQVARQGGGNTEKNILSRRDEINRKLEAVKNALRKEQIGIAKVGQETQNQASLPAEQGEQVKNLQEDNRNNQKALRDLARIAEAEPMLGPVAEQARDVADRELSESQKALDQAPQQSPSERTRRFEKANRQLASAVKRLEEMKQTNEKLAQERLDEARLEGLAQRERQLAERAAELATKNPVLNPTTKEQAEKLRRQQEEIAADLERIARQSEPLKQALEQARGEQAREMAERARELAQAQRDLIRAEAESKRQRQAEWSAEMARKQQELTEQAAKLAEETREPAPAARTDPLKPEKARRAAEALKQGDTKEAVKHQDQAAAELERLAQAFERAVKLSADPREAARQLGQAEKALRQRVQEEIAKKDTQKPLGERLKPLQDEQNAIRQTVERLSVPPDQLEPNKVKKQIAEWAAQASESIQKQDVPQAQARMDEIRKMLDRLADLLPSLEQRRQKASQDVARLRQQQEEIAKQIEQIKKDDPNALSRLAEAARQQAETAEALSKLDAPDREARRERTAEALNRALADLLDRRSEDRAASQNEARRQLERLEQALRGQKPVDEQANDLARQQRELVRAAADPKTTPQQKQELARKQQRIAEQTRNLQVPEAPERQRNAAEQTKKAAQAAQAQPTSPETKKRMEEAARKLDELARQLAGQEGEVAKAERLARRQAEAAAEAEQEPSKTSTPDAQRRQQEIAHEAQNVRTGEEARREKQRALDALARAQQDPAKDPLHAQREAADTLRDLADRLAGRNDPAAKANELARQERELAQEMAAPEKGREVADRQKELARQLRRLDTKDAPREAKETGEKMAEAAKELAKAASPAKAKQLLDRAAESAEKLAEQLGKAQAVKKNAESATRTTSAKPEDQSPRRFAQKLAEKQRQLAKETQQKQQETKQKSSQPQEKTMQEIARKQNQLNQEASQLPGDREQRLLEQARTAMNKAEQALERNDVAQTQRKQTEAAEKLEQLSKQLPAQAPQPAERDRQRTPGATPRGLPNKEQSERARMLALRQRQLRQDVQRGREGDPAEKPLGGENPLSDLIRQQSEVARQADELAGNVSRELGEASAPAQHARQAGQAARDAARQLQAGAVTRARGAGEKTVEQFRQLAARLARGPRSINPQEIDSLGKARQLDQRQAEINRRLQSLARDKRAPSSQQQAQQQSLQEQAAELMRNLTGLARQTKDASQSRALERASEASQQARQLMQRARARARQGDEEVAHDAKEKAAQLLDRAGREASRAASASGSQPSPKTSAQAATPQSGRDLQQARQDMNRAREQLGQGQPGPAQSAMRQAAQSLARAAQHRTSGPPQPGQPGQVDPSTGLDRPPSGLADLSAFGLDKTPYAGKSWGELPGELRTKIVQDMKARYGEDYARTIKLYFEQIADTKKK
jgi:hypothetical protein